MARALFDSLTILAPAISAQSPAINTASAAAGLPTVTNGSAPRYVLVVASVATSIQFGPAGVAATALSAPVPANVPMVFNVLPCTHVSVFQAAVGPVTIAPLEDF